MQRDPLTLDWVQVDRSLGGIHLALFAKKNSTVLFTTFLTNAYTLRVVWKFNKIMQLFGFVCLNPIKD